MVRHLGGWWRLWIVLTIIYGAVVLAYTWLSWPSVASVRHDNRFLRQMSDDALLVLSRPKSKMTKDGWEAG